MKHLLKTSTSSGTLLLFRSTGQLPASVQFISVAVSCKRKSVPACARLFSQFLSLCCVQAFQQSPSITGVSKSKRVFPTLHVRERLLVRPHHGFHDRKHQHLYPRRYFRGSSRFCFTGKNNMCELYDHFSSERMGHGFLRLPNIMLFPFPFPVQKRSITALCYDSYSSTMAD